MQTRFTCYVFALFVAAVSVLLGSCSKTEIKTVTMTDTAGNAVPMGPVRPATASSNQFVTTLFKYNPAPGQFLNTSVADSAAATAVTGNDQGLVSLGAFGGYVVYGFDHTVINGAGPDLIVIGNAFPQLAEPGVVWVMQDQNGNGKPDDTWYELAGSETGQPGYIRGYSVTYTRPNPANGNVAWKDNHGNSGFVLTTAFKTQDYYPDDQASSYTLSGTLLPSVNINTSDSAFITSAAFKYGYCDNTAGGDYIDISSAIDSAGKTVSLHGVDFIKIQTGILFNMGSLGEQSTEVTGIADVSLYKP